MPSTNVLCSGMVDRVGQHNAVISFEVGGNKTSKERNIENHKVGVGCIVDLLLDKKNGLIKNKSEVNAIGHRVVHGGDRFSQTILIDDKVKSGIRDLFNLAPLHNPANLTGIEVAGELFPEAKQIAVFDTAFHQTIPLMAYKYAIPNNFLDKHAIRQYGFHGTSHKYVSEKAINYLGQANTKMVCIHLGNGCSITAIKDGKSIDHSLGFGPMNGLIMGTRSGDIDQSVVLYLMTSLGYSVDEVNTLLQKQSGMLGLTGYNDLRDIEAQAETGNRNCKLALAMSAYRIKKYIGSYAAIMNGLDTIVFTAGIGENSSTMRNLVCKDMDFLGIELDQEQNNAGSKEIREINTRSSLVKVLVVPTNEELEIAKQVHGLLA